MNAVRYYLAVCILVNHFHLLTEEEIIALPRIFGGAGSFFALSGFLMFASFEKHRQTRQFLVRRARRIFPPYFMVVLVAAFGFCLISSLPVSEYFASGQFWRYLVSNLLFLNFLGPDLPGVFPADICHQSVVNGALWTMKGEVVCYLTVPLVFMLIKKCKDNVPVALGGLVAIFGLMSLGCAIMESMGRGTFDVMRRQFVVMMLFYMGGLINYNLELISRYRRVIISVCALLLGVEYFTNYEFCGWLHWVYFYVVSPFVTGSMVILCSVTGHWGRLLARHESVTYDFYLIHWPLIQIFIFFGLVKAMGAYPALITIIFVCLLLAWLSNRYVSGPFLRTGKTAGRIKLCKR